MEESLFEGFGNEVVYVGAFVLMLLCLGLAWLSTHVRGPDGSWGSSSRRSGDQGERDGVSTTPLSPSDGASTMSTHPPSGGPEEEEEGGEEGHDVEVEEKETERELRSGVDGDPGEGVDPSGSPRLRQRQVGSQAAEQIRIRLKFLNDTERVVEVNLGDTIGRMKRTHFPGQEPQVRFIYGGQILQDEWRTLMSYGVLADCVIHCHIARTTAGTAPRRHFEGGLYNEFSMRADTLLNVGNLMLPLSLFMLSVMWYFRIAYKQLFTAPATVSLIGMTLLFGCFVFNTYRR